jgi:hypothetical protein
VGKNAAIDMVIRKHGRGLTDSDISPDVNRKFACLAASAAEPGGFASQPIRDLLHLLGEALSPRPDKSCCLNNYPAQLLCGAPSTV